MLCILVLEIVCHQQQPMCSTQKGRHLKNITSLTTIIEMSNKRKHWQVDNQKNY